MNEVDIAYIAAGVALGIIAVKLAGFIVRRAIRMIALPLYIRTEWSFLLPWTKK